MITTLDILDRLISFNTVSANSNLALMSYVQDFLTARRFRVQLIESPNGQRAGLYAEIGPAGGGILLSGHTDVVPVTGQTWTKDPFRLTRDNDRLYGRGTTDMKGYVAAVLALADRAANADLVEPLKIILSYDEEIGCVGIQEMLDRAAPLFGRPRACIVGEPTSMKVAIGHKGKAALRATFKGQAGHSALAPNFVNALHMATDFIGNLRDLQQNLKQQGAQDLAYSVAYSTVHVGTLSGGTALNIVPEHAEMLFEYRHLAQDAPEKLLERITASGHTIQNHYRALYPATSVQIDQYNAYPGLSVDEHAPVVAFAKAMARTNETTKVAFGTEAGFFADIGIPTVVCGPGSMEHQGHQADEYITVNQLAYCDDMLTRILTDLCAPK